MRALPRVAPDRLNAERIASELTQLDRPGGSEILRYVQSYKLTEDGNITEVLPVEWLAILTDVLALSQELDDHLPPRRFDEMGWPIPDPRRDRAYDDAVLGRLPKGVFVWWDEFERAYLERLRRWPEQQQKDGKLVRDPLISPELRSVIMEGFERFAALAPPADLPQEESLAEKDDEDIAPWREKAKSANAGPVKPENRIIPFREPKRRRDGWADVIIDAIKEFERVNGATANETQLWAALAASPPAGYHVEWNERAKSLTMPDASSLSWKSFSGRFRNLYLDSKPL